ncbi:tetratricopeptide repeat protein [Actinoplanes sp. NPDC049265]|uniref:tetratricopeptide repeat protein n=1 Tax=Actinoplanes sp. NPDC049265 TaxID=3363902 RepID=UPI003717BCFD
MHEKDYLDAALAEGAALAAGDVSLDGPLASLASVPGAETLLLGTSVYREPVEKAALLYQVGRPAPEAGNLDEWRTAEQRIHEILSRADVPPGEVDIEELPEPLRTALAPYWDIEPIPPVRADDLESALDACLASGLLVTDSAGLFFVPRWTAAELARRAVRDDRRDDVIAAHGRAADYWRWHLQAWARGSAAQAADLSEVHHHYSQAYGLGDLASAEDLALSSFVLATILDRLGRHAESLPHYQRAVSLRRDLADETVPETLVRLAESLNELGTQLSRMGRAEESLDAAYEAAAVFRQLNAAEPGAFESELTAVLGNLANRLAGMGRTEDALQLLLSESIPVLRRLAAADPETHEPDLAHALTNLSPLLDQANRQEEALSVGAEAIELGRRHAATGEPDRVGALAAALDNFGGLLAAADRYEEAIDAGAESVSLFRRLAAIVPAAQSDLALALRNLGATLAEADRRDEAVRALTEAVALYRRLAAANPGGYRDSLAAATRQLEESRDSPAGREP